MAADAQGKASSGVIGVRIGGDQTSGYAHAKQQLFRTLDDTNPDARLAKVFKVAGHDDDQQPRRRADGLRRHHADRLQGRRAEPAAGFRVDRLRLLGLPPTRRPADRQTGAIREWQFRDPAQTAIPMVDAAAGTQAFALTGQEKVLRAPIDEATIRSLKVGDVVLVSGRAYTGRDAVHHHLMRHEPPGPTLSVALMIGVLVAEEGGRRLARDGGGADHQHPRGSWTRPTSSSATAFAR